jgi:hypothetical protein
VAVVRKRNRKQIEIDCVAVKRRAQRKIMAATEGMSPKAEIAYFDRRATEGPFQELRKRIRKSSTTGRPSKGRTRAS